MQGSPLRAARSLDVAPSAPRPQRGYCHSELCDSPPRRRLDRSGNPCYPQNHAPPGRALRDRRELRLLPWPQWLKTWDGWKGSIQPAFRSTPLSLYLEIDKGDELQACLLIADGHPPQVALHVESSFGLPSTVSSPSPRTATGSTPTSSPTSKWREVPFSAAP